MAADWLLLSKPKLQGVLSKTRVNLAYQVVQFNELPLGLGEIMHEDFVGRAAVGRSS